MTTKLEHAVATLRQAADALEALPPVLRRQRSGIMLCDPTSALALRHEADRLESIAEAAIAPTTSVG